MKPNISVIIPVYNVEKYLGQCLESVIGQKDCNIEIICVNDGATDSSGDILQEYQKQDNRIRIITQQNEGLSGARNTGIRNAEGEYICFLDSDDMLCENSLRELYDMAKSKELDILCYDAECIYENEDLRKKQYKDMYYQRKRAYNQISEGKEIFAQMVEDNAFCDAAWILFIKREWLLANNIWFWPRLIHEDCLFSFQCFMKAQRVMHTNKRYIIYRIRNNSIMTSRLGYESVYGRLICFHHVLQFLYETELNEKHERAIIKFAQFLRVNANWIGTLLYKSELQRLDELPFLQKFELEMLGVGEQTINGKLYKQGFVAGMEAAKDIVIYGAGQRGLLVWDYIKKRGIREKVKCFMVSATVGNPPSIEEVAIKGTEEIESIDKECLIIIAIKGLVQEEIEEQLRQRGYNNVLILDDVMTTLIRKELTED